VRRRPGTPSIRRAAVVAALAFVAPLIGVSVASRQEPAPARAASRAPFAVVLPSAAALSDHPAAPAPTEYPAAAASRPVGESAVVLQATNLRESPGGPAIARIEPYTEFGSPRVLAVVGQRGDWLAVLATELPDGQAGWIPARRTALVADAYAIHVDVDRRLLTVYRDGRPARQLPVAVGSPSTPTPMGRFATTDKLTTTGPSPYGCCVLALNGHQSRLATGWTGGDRLAIHGTLEPGTIGAAASLGCLRVAAADARWLVTTIPLGTVVTIGG
jgi:lipoprotein-anchoring transpeptidase ErfK/SrfK